MATSGTFKLHFVDSKERLLSYLPEALEVSIDSFSGANGQEAATVARRFFLGSIQGLMDDEKANSMSVKRLMLEDCQLGRCVTLTKQVLQDQIIYAVLDGENRQLSEQEPGRSKSEPPRPCHPVDGPFGPIEKRTKIFVPRKKRLEKLEKPHQLQASIIEEVRSRGQGLAKTSPAGVPGSEYGVGDVRKCMSSAPQEQQLVLDGISDMADDHLGGHDPTGVQWSAFASFE